MDLAFGSGNAYLERWNATDNNGRIVISVSANHDTDIPQLAGAAQEFNRISQTNQLSGMIKDGMNGNIAIKFIPENGMDAIALNTSDDLSNREFRITRPSSRRSPAGSSISTGICGATSATTR